MFPHNTPWDFDIDRLLNRLITAPPWRFLPPPVAHFLGHRSSQSRPLGSLLVILWAFLGIFSAILIIEAVSSRVPLFEAHHVPMIVGSFRAAAVFEFFAIDSPLSQPRNAIIGQLLAIIVGVSLAKLLRLSGRYDQMRWLGGALSCASATALMGLTKTVHPPAGATALLAVVDSNLSAVGWLLLPAVLLGCALMLAVALLVNNFQRRFPLYWLTPADLATEHRRRDAAANKGADDEGPARRSRGSRELSEKATTDINSRTNTAVAAAVNEAAPTIYAHDAVGIDEERVVGGREASSPHGRSTMPGAAADSIDIDFAAAVIVRPGHIRVPAHVNLTADEQHLLLALSRRL